jgi:hypothetical protein
MLGIIEIYTTYIRASRNILATQRTNKCTSMKDILSHITTTHRHLICRWIVIYDKTYFFGVYLLVCDIKQQRKYAEYRPKF